MAAAGLGLMRAAGSAVLAVTLAGLIGSTLDSVLGAGVQARYRCAACGATPEVARHDGCPTRATRIAGLPGLDNDAVNWIATLSGAATAVLLEHLFSPR